MLFCQNSSVVRSCGVTFSGSLSFFFELIFFPFGFPFFIDFSFSFCFFSGFSTRKIHEHKALFVREWCIQLSKHLFNKCAALCHMFHAPISGALLQTILLSKQLPLPFLFSVSCFFSWSLLSHECLMQHAVAEVKLLLVGHKPRSLASQPTQD